MAKHLTFFEEMTVRAEDVAQWFGAGLACMSPWVPCPVQQ